MASPRLIDKLPHTPRPKEVQVLALGMSRTGTMSLKTAFEQLGYTPYHMSVAVPLWKKLHLRYWLEALKAKYQRQGKPYGRLEFDKFLGNFDVFSDIPCILFVDELLDAYPSAKVILTNRDVDSWVVSVEKVFHVILSWKTLPLLAHLDKHLWGPYLVILRMTLDIWTSGNWEDRQALRNTYVDHYSHIRRVVPKERLLEFQSADGWEPLCQFLAKPVPEGPYPRINEAAATVKIHVFLYWLRVVQVLGRYVLTALVVVVALTVPWYIGRTKLGSGGSL